MFSFITSTSTEHTEEFHIISRERRAEGEPEEATEKKASSIKSGLIIIIN